MDIVNWNRLPKELINIILLFDGTIKYRNGKYINQININNYNLLLEIPKPINKHTGFDWHETYERFVQFSNEKSLNLCWFVKNNVYKIDYNNENRLRETLNKHRYFFK